MNSRDKLIESLRPEINYRSDLASNNAIADFQNETLRPILKFQNELYLSAFLEQAERKKIVINFNDVIDLNAKVKTHLSKDHGFKAYLTGMTIALFTQEEFDFYLKNQRDVNKRIASMLTERLIDQLSNLK